MSTTMGVKLDDSVRERLKLLGATKDRSPHWLMKQAIQEYLAREETHEREKQEDIERWQRYTHSGEYISHEEARTRLTELAAHARAQTEAAE